MLRNVHPVEELFEIRAEMRALKAREAELRAFFVDRAGPTERIGPFHEVIVSRPSRRVFKRNRLPEKLLADPFYWATSATPVVKLARRDPDTACNGRLPPTAIQTEGMAQGFSDSAPRVQWVAYDPSWEDDPLIDELDRFDA